MKIQIQSHIHEKMQCCFSPDELVQTILIYQEQHTEITKQYENYRCTYKQLVQVLVINKSE